MNKTGKLKCRHCIGPNCKDYTMRCDILKTMPDGRLKILVYGYLYWKDYDHIQRVKYVPTWKVIINE